LTDFIVMGVIFETMGLFSVWFFCFAIRYHFVCPCCAHPFRLSLLRYAVKSKILWSSREWRKTWDGGVTVACPACGEENWILPG